MICMVPAPNLDARHCVPRRTESYQVGEAAKTGYSPWAALTPEDYDVRSDARIIEEWPARCRFNAVLPGAAPRA
jgi:hypothetical protein